MNPPNEPSNVPSPSGESPANSGAVPPLPPPLVLSGPGSVIEALLKRPAQLVGALQEQGSQKFAFWLAVFAVLALAAYGLIVGGFSGGTQLLAAPIKISLGAVISMLICLPSLFIFTSLTGADVSFRSIIGVASATLALTSLLLIGFAPVAWVFSQSSESVAFIGTLHLIFWFIGLGFGLRLLGLLLDFLRIKERIHLRVWGLIFVLVSLQMATALRPIVGTAQTWLPTEKKFFLAHWIESLDDAPKPAPKE